MQQHVDPRGEAGDNLTDNVDDAEKQAGDAGKTADSGATRDNAMRQPTPIKESNSTATSVEGPEALDALSADILQLVDNIQRVIKGKNAAIKRVVAALLAGGHVLIEDVPGVGKTMFARALARSIDINFKRIQCTPDLLPADLIGVNIFDQKTGSFRFHKGPLFAGVVLADEVNRATPRTQSAMLEAMSERQVSVDTVTYRLPEPFIVLATQNPIEFMGTYPLPEAQLDRFLLRIKMGYPDPDSELEMILDRKLSQPIDSLQPVLGFERVLQMQEMIKHVGMARGVAEYILELARHTREHRHVSLGVSPRGCLMMYRVCQAWAAIQGREFVIPDDVQELVPPVWGHRVREKGAQAMGSRSVRVDEILGDIIKNVVVPME